MTSTTVRRGVKRPEMLGLGALLLAGALLAAVGTRLLTGPLAVLSQGPVEGMRVVTDGAAELFGVEFGAGK